MKQLKIKDLTTGKVFEASPSAWKESYKNTLVKGKPRFVIVEGEDSPSGSEKTATAEEAKELKKKISEAKSPDEIKGLESHGLKSVAKAAQKKLAEFLGLGVDSGKGEGAKTEGGSADGQEAGTTDEGGSGSGEQNPGTEDQKV